jgi:NAD(P)-dependent dehydrogenase (short-subunit alcohol dehydrogenase family)
MSKNTAVVIGGSRGLGRGAVDALKSAGREVIAIARDVTPLKTAGVQALAGDATDANLAERVLREHAPGLVIINAGAAPTTVPFYELEWADFERNWQADTRIAFTWLKLAIRMPLPTGSHLIVVSSGAAIAGSPVSGGYASAKRGEWFLAGYAASEIERNKLGIRVSCVLPNLNPSSELGRAGIAAYARRAGVTDEEFASRFLPHLTPAIFGGALVELDAHHDKYPQLAYRLGGDGLKPVV